MTDKDPVNVCLDDIVAALYTCTPVGRRTLKQQRKLLGLTQREAAGVMGVPYRTWQNWENGVNTIPLHSEWYWDYHLSKIMDLRNWK